MQESNSEPTNPQKPTATLASSASQPIYTMETATPIPMDDATATAAVPATAAETCGAMRSALESTKQVNHTSACEAVLTMMKIITNVMTKPQDPKVRSLRLGNKNFHAKVGGVAGCMDFLQAAGFVKSQIVNAMGAEEDALVLKNEVVPVIKQSRELLEVRGER